MQFNANALGFYRHHLKVVRVVDGDGLWVQDIFTKAEEEIRLLGIDAPEIKKCRKLLQDERETHLPGQLLIEMGNLSWEHLRSLAPIGEPVSILSERANAFDPYGRTLAYVFLQDGSCLNERMVRDGFAKPYDRYFCARQVEYQLISGQARLACRGLFARVNKF